MKAYVKAMLGAVLLTGTAITATAPAEARVGVVLNLGIPAPVVAAPVGPPTDCYGPYYRAACAFPAYSEPVFWNGIWFNNAPYRFVGGRREFWVHGGWHDARPRSGFHR